jgi:iron complex outermembrane receptor protein
MHRANRSGRRRAAMALFAFVAIPFPLARANDAADPPARSVGDVMTTATRAERGVMEIAGDATVIEREEIERSGARTVPELLRRQAGLLVSSTTTNPVGVQVESRGFGPGGSAGSSLLVLVDGRRVNQADSGVVDWALLDLDEVQRIEIVRGPASAVWGDNAVGGVIQIFTRPPDGRPRGTLRLRGGTHEVLDGSLAASGRSGPLLLSVFGSALTNDAYRDRANYQARQFDGRAELDLGDRLALSLRGGTLRDDRNLPGSLFKNPDAGDELERDGRRAASPRSDEDESNVRSHYVDGVLEAALAEGTLLRVQPWFQWRDEDATITAISFGETRIEFHKKSFGLDAQLQLDRPLGPFQNRVILGGQFLRDNTDREIDSSFGLTENNNRRFVFSGFVQEELQLSEDLLLTGGFRFDRAEYRLKEGARIERPDFGIWSPKASLVYRLCEPASAYFSYARGFRFPNFDEGLPIFTGLPDLTPQKSESFETGLKLQTDRVRGTLALYWMDVDDELIFNPVDFLNENFDDVRHLGVELWSELQLLKWLLFTGSYTFEDVEVRDHDGPGFDFEGERVPMIPRHRASMGFVAQLPYWLELGWNLNYVGKRTLANDYTNDRERLGGHVHQDLLLAFRPPLGEWLGLGDKLEGSLRFAVYNVAGERYADFGATATRFDLGVPVVADAVNPAAKRTWLLGLVLKVTP